MSKKTFVNGSVVNPQWLNSIQNLQFNKDNGEELFDGEYYRLTDDALSNANDQIKNQFYTHRDRLLVYQSSGLVCDYYGGTVFQQDGEALTISPASITVADDATTYIFIDSTGAVATGSSLPPICYPMAKVVAASGSVSTITDLRPQDSIQPRPDVQRVFGGTGVEGDYNSTDGEVLDQGVYYFKNFTVSVGHTITIDKYAKIFISGNCLIEGTIVITPALPKTNGIRITAYSNTRLGETRGSGIGSSIGFQAPPQSYSWYVQPYGSSGGTGFVQYLGNSPFDNSISFVIGDGGAGGGGLWIEAFKSITVNGTIQANGEDAQAPSYQNGDTGGCSGSAGGSGGSIILSSADSITCGGTSVVSVKGGDGSPGIGVGNAGNISTNPIDSNIFTGGGGGAGGYIVFISPNTNTSAATLEVDGGTAGLTHTNELNTQHLGNAGAPGASNGGSSGGNEDGGTGQIIYRNFAML